MCDIFDSNYIKQQEILNQICISLVKFTRKPYRLILKSPSNAIDFITDGEIKTIQGIEIDLNKFLTLKLEPVGVYESGVLTSLNLQLVLMANIQDFTHGSDESTQIHRYLAQYKALFCDKNEKFWYAKIKKLHMIISRNKDLLFCEFIPSHRLSKLVGREPLSKYQILDKVSKYIFENELKSSDGLIRLNKTLSSWFGKNRISVNQEEIITFLIQNSLLTEEQIENHFDLKGSVYGRFVLPRKYMANLETSSGSSKYLFGPIT